MHDVLTQTLAKIIKHSWESTTLHFHRLYGITGCKPKLKIQLQSIAGIKGHYCVSTNGEEKGGEGMSKKL